MFEEFITLNAEQVKQIFLAGVNRGAEEEASSQCGIRPTGRRYDSLVDAIYDIVNGPNPIVHVCSEDIEEWLKNA